MSFGIQSTSFFGTSQQADGTGGTSLRRFANLDLTEDQRTQIRSIFQNAKSQGLTHAQVQSQIDAILTPAQQTQLQSNQQSMQSTKQGAEPFANLNLTSDQQSQITSIFTNAQSQGLSQTQVAAQINAILTPAQQTTLQSDLQTLQPASSPPPPPSDPLANLNLTADQQSKIQTILQNAQSQGLSFEQVTA